MSFKKLLVDKLPSFIIDSLKKVFRKEFKNITKVSKLQPIFTASNLH